MAKFKVDLAIGDDDDLQVAEVMLKGIANGRVTMTRTGKALAVGSAEFEFVGDPRDLFAVIVNVVGITPSDRELLNMYAHNIRIDELDPTAPDVAGAEAEADGLEFLSPRH